MLFMALLAQKGNLSRDEQDEISAKLAQLGVTMSWNGTLMVISRLPKLTLDSCEVSLRSRSNARCYIHCDRTTSHSLR
jgi:hypothetical protein